MFSLTVPIVSLAAILAQPVIAGTNVWSGSFNAYSTVADFDNWSWSNEVGEYQWYIHGSQPTSHYLALDPSYKNPADSSETHGLKLTIDSTATWNSNMERTELIPQTTQNLGTGELFYHFSVMHSATNPPNSAYEHQIVFFESHFTELKYGVAPNATNLEWMIQGQPQWGTPFTPGTWYNFAYDINFSAGTVGLWASTGGDPLQRVVPNAAASTSTNSEDWHLGVLRLVSGTDTEDWYFSGVYIENGPITTAIGSGSGSGSSSSSSPSLPGSTTSATSSTSAPPTSTTSASGPQQTQWGQCGGTNWTGPTVCIPPYTCKAVSPPYYSQCQ
ncbi:carbohydrate-binding module family 1 protein [Leucogyrophana mollusca]|uniref:Carbohydrate-binding module family 1 protein n=1 Tax=Leucogyrophana mollusca TaxID=85980 RepID=A0ACB8BTM3_9AGAM|nr:carbohydrate-binding module family 1 protein [Leucogyrophana mollusca]